MGTDEFFREHGYYPTTCVPRLGRKRRPSRAAAKPNALIECLKPGSNHPGRPRGEGHTQSVSESIKVAEGFRLVKGFNLLLRSERERKPPYCRDPRHFYVMENRLEDSLEDLLNDDPLRNFDFEAFDFDGEAPEAGPSGGTSFRDLFGQFFRSA